MQTIDWVRFGLLIRIYRFVKLQSIRKFWEYIEMQAQTLDQFMTRAMMHRAWTRKTGSSDGCCVSQWNDHGFYQAITSGQGMSFDSVTAGIKQSKQGVNDLVRRHQRRPLCAALIGILSRTLRERHRTNRFDIVRSSSGLLLDVTWACVPLMQLVRSYNILTYKRFNYLTGLAYHHRALLDTVGHVLTACSRPKLCLFSIMLSCWTIPSKAL